jgi:hypothetical protein
VKSARGSAQQRPPVLTSEAADQAAARAIGRAAAESNPMYEVRSSLIARAILDYLRKHPDAQDTVAGITEWWLPEEKIKTRAITVKEALDELVGKGLVLARKGKDSQIHYRINRRKAREIASFINRE